MVKFKKDNEKGKNTTERIASAENEGSLSEYYVKSYSPLLAQYIVIARGKLITDSDWTEGMDPTLRNNQITGLLKKTKSTAGSYRLYGQATPLSKTLPKLTVKVAGRLTWLLSVGIDIYNAFQSKSSWSGHQIQVTKYIRDTSIF